MTKHKPLYREVLREAWTLTKTHKKLWLFGFFAAFLGTGGVVEFFLRAFGKIPQTGWDPVSLAQTAYPGAPLVGTFAVLHTSATHITPGGWFALLIVAAVFVGLLWFLSTSEGALIAAVKTKAKKPQSVEKVFQGGAPFGWRITGLHIVSRIIIAFSFLLTSLPLLTVVRTPNPSHLALYFISFIIFFPLTIIISFLTVYAVCAVVIHRQTMAQAIRTSWRLFHTHWLVSVETALILFSVSVLGAVLMAVASMLVAIPFILLMITAVIVGSSPLLSFALITMLTLVVAIVLVVGAFLATFELVTWTLLYERIAKKPALAKLVRLFHALPKVLWHRV